MKELYRQANVPFILIGGRETIIQFSMPIIDIFGQREDQLIGHSIQTLFYDDHYGLFNKIRHRIAGIHFIKGINSNDQVFNLRVNVRPIYWNVLLQIMPIDDTMEYEELIQVHNDLFNEILWSSHPFFMFQQSQHSQPFMHQRNLSRFTFLLMLTDMQQVDARSPLESVKDYFSSSIVLYSNYSTFCSLFVGENHMAEAFECYQEFAPYDPKKAGVMLEGYDLSVYF